MSLLETKGGGYFLLSVSPALPFRSKPYRNQLCGEFSLLTSPLSSVTIHMHPQKHPGHMNCCSASCSGFRSFVCESSFLPQLFLPCLEELGKVQHTFLFCRTSTLHTTGFLSDPHPRCSSQSHCPCLIYLPRGASLTPARLCRKVCHTSCALRLVLFCHGGLLRCSPLSSSGRAQMFVVLAFNCLCHLFPKQPTKSNETPKTPLSRVSCLPVLL